MLKATSLRTFTKLFATWTFVAEFLLNYLVYKKVLSFNFPVSLLTKLQNSFKSLFSKFDSYEDKYRNWEYDRKAREWGLYFPINLNDENNKRLFLFCFQKFKFPFSKLIRLILHIIYLMIIPNFRHEISNYWSLSSCFVLELFIQYHYLLRELLNFFYYYQITYD